MGPVRACGLWFQLTVPREFGVSPSSSFSTQTEDRVARDPKGHSRTDTGVPLFCLNPTQSSKTVRTHQSNVFGTRSPCSIRSDTTAASATSRSCQRLSTTRARSYVSERLGSGLKHDHRQAVQARVNAPPRPAATAEDRDLTGSSRAGECRRPRRCALARRRSCCWRGVFRRRSPRAALPGRACR